MLRKLILIACLSVLSGCTFYQPTATAYVDCDGSKCDDLWQRAQTWLAKNSIYRIQVMNENIIQTYGPLEYRDGDGVAYTVTKEKQTNGKTRIYIRGQCYGTVYGCVSDPSPFTNLLHKELVR
jgi:hypothetical protein